MADQHRGGRTRDRRHAVMLGQPVAQVAGIFGRLGGARRVAEAFFDGAAFDDLRQVEYGKGYHHGFLGREDQADLGIAQAQIKETKKAANASRPVRGGNLPQPALRHSAAFSSASWNCPIRLSISPASWAS